MATLEIIQARIKKLQTQAEALIAKRAHGALNQIRELMIKHGLTTEDIERRAKARRERSERLLGTKTARAKPATAAKGKLPPKYRDPKTGATWSGHARPPAWIKDVKDRSKFLIDASAAGSEPAVALKAATKKTAKKATAKKAVTAKSAGRKVVKSASVADVKTVAKKVAVKSAGKKTAVKKAAAKSAAPTLGKRVIAKKAAAKAPAKKAAAKKAPAKTTAPVVEAPVTVQAPAATAGEA
ncbi:H-NS histone family protein [Paraburkholderia phymatum]|uniref:Histone family protein nucleoid-structuring protein H-NS n=1 Tax=Paraburkholderia phymatum (strain DSM 17167 / CIP 108236 / LMG 21445 / STM815) TaxID=391038 RepID=B2JNN0_PARP8|nr:H-NS histone family protein [Paraburkholderia phymatum]ACC72981.1 histone family protein nucleoid-structuring protein H-NS [Paraburkholderia phymatum STM815]